MRRGVWWCLGGRAMRGWGGGGGGAWGGGGPAGAQGAPGLVYQGAYSSVTNYALGDVVLWQGASYTSLIAGNHGNTPSLSPTQWGGLPRGGPGGARVDRGR